MMRHNRPFWHSLPVLVIAAIYFFCIGGFQAQATDDRKSAGGVPAQRPMDFNGDGKSDWAVVRNVGGRPQGQVLWIVQENGGPGVVTYFSWGSAQDFFVPEDYDGDGRTDFAVWRPGGALPGQQGAFYIFQSQTNAVRAELFGIGGDDPSIVGDYDGDLKADIAVYRGGGNGPDQSYWFYRTTANGPVFSRQWGTRNDFRRREIMTGTEKTILPSNAAPGYPGRGLSG